jgi:hypothetical protein
VCDPCTYKVKFCYIFGARFEGGSKILRNIDILPHNYMSSQAKIPQFEFVTFCNTFLLNIVQIINHQQSRIPVIKFTGKFFNLTF